MMDFRDSPASIRTGEELPLAILEPFLRTQFSEPSGDFTVLQFPSGHSNLTYAIQLGSRQVVLRRPPFGSKVKSAHDMNREFRVLSKLHAVYPPAPEVFLFCDDVSILGVPFYLMAPIRGVILRRDPPPGLPFSPATARAVCESFIDNLAWLHSIDYATIGLADFGKPAGYLERQVKGWIERYHASKTHDIPEIEKLAPWIQQNLPQSSTATLIHNDYKLDNVVLDPADLAHIVGVLDWEMATIGDSLSDVGTVLAYWVEVSDPDDLQGIRWGPTNFPGSLTRGELVERYARVSGRDLEDISFYLVFARFKLAVIVQQIYYRYHLGLTQDSRFAAMSQVVQVLMRAAWHAAQSSSI
jgi:aminoglycoside phosphotransferase (APT) family kinase protein